MSSILSRDWWKAAGIRALRTAIVIAIPYVPFLVADQNYLIVLSAAAFGAFASLLTSLFGIAETSGTTVPWYYAIAERAVKTAAQSLLTAFGTATLFSDVDWNLVLPVVVTAVLGSVLLGFLKTLPETVDPIAQAVIEVNVAKTDSAGIDTGETTVQVIPAMAQVGNGQDPNAVG